MKKTFDIMVAYCKTTRGIGMSSTLPCKPVKSAIKHFNDATIKTISKDKQNCIIMGKNTWDTMDGKPKHDRFNIVISSDASKNPIKGNIITSTTLHDALNVAFKNNDIENIYVIGGETIYKEAIKRNDLNAVIAAEIDREYECDKFMPKLNDQFSESTRYKIDGDVEVVKFIKRTPVLV